MRAILWQIAPHCQSVMVSGIDDHGILQRVLPFNFAQCRKPVGPGRAGNDSFSTTFLRPCLRPGKPSTLKAGGLMTLSFTAHWQHDELPGFYTALKPTPLQNARLVWHNDALGGSAWYPLDAFSARKRRRRLGRRNAASGHEAAGSGLYDISLASGRGQPRRWPRHPAG